MDPLSRVVGSAVRADLLALLFGAPRRAYGVRDLSREIGHSHGPVQRELARLAGSGLVRSSALHGRKVYEADFGRPPARELAAFVRQTRGRIPQIREALVHLRTPTLAWVVRSADADSPTRLARARGFDLVVLSAAPRSLVRVQLAKAIGWGQIHCMSFREWVTRLDKGDVTLRHARRARKIWVLGGYDELVARERSVIESKRMLERAMSEWQDEMSDDWDDSWDPSRAAVAATR